MYRRPHPFQVWVRVEVWGGRTYLLTARGPLEPGRHTSGWGGTCLSLRVGSRESPQEVASKLSPDNQPSVMGGGRYQSQHGGQHMEGVAWRRPGFNSGETSFDLQVAVGGCGG